MKRKIKSIALLFILSNFAFSQVGIGTNDVDTSAILELDATNKALLLPRVANSNTIPTPTDGMIIYAENPKCFKAYQDGGWKDLNPCTPIVSAMTVASPTYQGMSVINSQGIGYNGEAVATASTITVSVTATEPTNYSFSAVHPATGLTYTASGSFAAAGTFSVVLSNNNAFIPETTFGTLTLPLIGASNALNLLPRIDIKSLSANGWIAGTHFTDVVYGTQTWMDRNLGAKRVATASNDALSYGNYYQWGRPADGHEITVLNGSNPTSGRGLYATTNIQSPTAIPGHNNFITIAIGGNDWDTSESSRWHTVNQGPCPTGYHVPTASEWQTAITNGSWANSTEVYNSVLKIPNSGQRTRTTGTLATGSFMWSSTNNAGTPSSGIIFNYNATPPNTTTGYQKSVGLTVRCIKN